MRLASFAALSLVVAVSASARAQSPAPDARTAYQRQALGVRNLHLVGLDLSAASDRQAWMYGHGAWDAFRGLDHHPISEEAFYRIVGRDDLLRRYEHTARVKKGLAIGSGALILGGAIFAAVTALRRGNMGSSTPACTSAPCYTPPLPGPSPDWGFAVAGTGIVSLIVSQFIDPTPIGADEADRLARDYNQSLRHSLGLTDTASRN